MTTYVAFLRGINVGGHAKVAMADLRELMESLDHGDVRTHLQSGNVLFSTSRRDTAALTRDIEGGIRERFGLDVSVIVRTRAQLAKAIDGNPLPEATKDPKLFHVMFLAAKPAKSKVASIDPEKFPNEEIRFGGDVLYVWFRQGFGRTKLTNDFLEKRLGTRVTSRNWNTVTKLLSLADTQT